MTGACRERTMNELGEVSSRRFGSYSLVRKLGEGGMAEVYLASGLDARGELMPVALKVMKPFSSGDLDAADLFATEADVMSLLRHPNLVQLYEVGKHAERLFLAIEYLPGGDLETLSAALRRQNRPFPPSIALQVGIDLLKGLAYVHQAQGVTGTSLNLVHGDINPSNIFLGLEPGRAKLGDFGVVSSDVLGGGLPEGVAAGKLHYLSPEQVTGKPLSPSSDIFAVGVVMFELLLGVRPFDGRDQAETLERISAGRFEHPGNLSKHMAEIFERALARNPKSRFPSAGAFAGELLRYQLDSDLQLREEDFSLFVQEVVGEL